MAALEKLLARDGDLPASALSASQRAALEELARRTGAVNKIPSGRGSCYRAGAPEMLRDHLSALRPEETANISGDLPQRAINIGNTRDSKGHSHRHSQFYLVTKAIGQEVHWRRSEVEFDLSMTTAIAGAGAISLSEADDWSTDSPLWLVENQALFDRTDWFPGHGPATLAYYAGHFHGEFLRWLSARQRAPRLILFADYDGIGLLNFVRLRKASVSACEFWLMNNWRELLSRYGNQPLWERTRIAFERAVAELQIIGIEPELAELCRALLDQGLALEHEAIWLNSRLAP